MNIPLDKHSNHFLKPVCVGRIEPRHIEDNLVPHLTNETILVTDSHRAYKTVANRHKIPLRQIPSGKHKSNGFSLGHINGYHSNISRFFKKYREVASKYVDLYLALFYWKEKHKDFETIDQNTEMGAMMKQRGFRMNGMSKIYADGAEPIEAGIPEAVGAELKLRAQKRRSDIRFHGQDILPGNWLFKHLILKPDTNAGIRFYETNRGKERPCRKGDQHDHSN